MPYRVSLTIEYPEDQETVTVFHADGEDKVTIEACGEQLSAYSAVVGGGACPEGADAIVKLPQPEILLVTPPGKGRPQSILLPDDIEPGFYRVAKSLSEQETDKLLELYAQFEVR